MIVKFTKKELKLLKNSVYGIKQFVVKEENYSTIVSKLRFVNNLDRHELLTLIKITDILSETLYTDKEILKSIDMSDLNKKLNRIFDENESR